MAKHLAGVWGDDEHFTSSIVLLPLRATPG